ncbi:MAG: CDGSH iron-sulfur domain-containing protein [Gemmatimonadota bacterium]
MSGANIRDQKPIVIAAYDNGPYLVRGPVRVEDAEGNAWDTEGKASVALCRCGQSANKPFCDGTHSTIGFTATERASGGDA